MDEAARQRLIDTFRGIADDGRVDTGYGPGGADFWFSVGGIEYFVTAKVT